jgi:hypothetical protein
VVAIDFVGPLPKDEGFDALVTMMDRLGADLQLAACKTDMSAEEFAGIFFDKWYCENGCPKELVTDRDKLFISKFWKALMRLTGIKHKLSTAYHPQTDGASERTNKTVVQCLRYYVDRNQTGWVKALPKVRFDIMNTVNASTGFTPFNLKSGYSPRLIPPLLQGNGTPHIIVMPPDTTPEEVAARAMVERLEMDIQEAKDSLTAAKISQAHHANKDREPEPSFKVGDRVMLATSNRRREYTQAKKGRVAKFMPRFDGPYEITSCHPETSNYTLRIPNHRGDKANTFHVSHLKQHRGNDDGQFPGRALPRPGPIVTENGSSEYYVEKILDERKRGRGMQYLVRWLGYGEESDLWLPRSELMDSEALDVWENRGGIKCFRDGAGVRDSLT